MNHEDECISSELEPLAQTLLHLQQEHEFEINPIQIFDAQEKTNSLGLLEVRL